jgi:hypothetical protein
MSQNEIEMISGGSDIIERVSMDMVKGLLIMNYLYLINLQISFKNISSKC